MVVELQQPDVVQNEKVWIPEVGTFDSLPLDPCQGAVYKLTSDDVFLHKSVLTQEKASHKLINEVCDQIEQFKSTAKKAADNHNEQMKTLMEKAQNEIEVQFEQVKADLDRTLMNDLKSVDKRLQALESFMQSLSDAKQSSNSQALIILVALSIVLSLSNMIVLFVHH